eukprot:g4392.t1 g4392   contig15:926472-927379(+)
MTVSDIGKIVSAVTATQLAADLLSRRYIFQSERYKRQVTSLERAKGRRDKTVAAIAAKQSAPVKEEPKKQKYVPPSKKQTQQTSQKSLEKDKKKLEREEEELSTIAAEVARRHTMSGFYTSIAFFILFRILAAEYVGRPVALLPFEPFKLMQKVTFRGLGVMGAGEMQKLWMESVGGPTATIPGAEVSLPPDVTNASQACAFAFVYLLCSLSVKMMVNMMFGTKPPPGADNGMNTFMDSPQSRKMLESFGLDVDEVKEARNAVGFG